MLNKVKPYAVTAAVVLIVLAVASKLLPESLKSHVRI